MKKSLVLTTAALALAFTATASYAKPEAYDIDPSHTTIQFGIGHVDFSKMMGKFETYTSTTQLDLAKPENSKVSIVIDPKSVKTSSADLDKHLQGPDFFNSEKHGEIKFVSTKVVKTGEKTYTLTGDFTMLGVTKPLTLDVVFNKSGEFFGKQRAGFSMKGLLKRSEFGMSYGAPDTIADDVSIYVEVEAVKRDATPPQKKKS